MEELAKLEAERGTPGYAVENGIMENSAVGAVDGFGGNGRGGMMAGGQNANGSVNPAGIIAPAIVATFISTLTAVVYCKGKDRRWRV